MPFRQVSLKSGVKNTKREKKREKKTRKKKNRQLLLSGSLK